MEHNCALCSGVLKTLLSRMGLPSVRPDPANRVFQRSDWQPVKVRKPSLAQDPHGRDDWETKALMHWGVFDDLCIDCIQIHLPVHTLMLSIGRRKTFAGRKLCFFVFLKKLGVKEQEFAFMEPRSRCLGRMEAFLLNQYSLHIPLDRSCLSQGKRTPKRDSSLKSCRTC